MTLSPSSFIYSGQMISYVFLLYSTRYILSQVVFDSSKKYSIFFFQGCRDFDVNFIVFHVFNPARKCYHVHSGAFSFHVILFVQKYFNVKRILVPLFNYLVLLACFVVWLSFIIWLFFILSVVCFCNVRQDRFGMLIY